MNDSDTQLPPGQVAFFGPEPARLFTLELAESLAGVLANNMVHDPRDPDAGFVSASIGGRPWTGTMWTRDAGVFLRELVLWGYTDHARLVAKYLIGQVRENEEGFCTFPMYLKRGEPGSGSELDGTAAILIGLVLLWERLAPDDPLSAAIDAFLDSPASPLAYVLNRLARSPLVAGSGEFGGGCGIEGEFFNVVQNNLVRLAMLAAARRSQRLVNHAQENLYRRAAAQISRNMLRYLRDPDGSWLWTLSTETLAPDPAILDHPINKGFGGLNGILAMEADVCGLTPLSSGWEGLSSSLKTFERLLNTPKRKGMFEKYGIWTQFDELWAGLMTSPSYGHCYAIQAMLLSDRLDMAGRAIDFLAEMTYQPLPGNRLDRESPYHFYERCYLPELLDVWNTPEVQNNPVAVDWIRNGFDGEHFDQGCGALNLVNVAEPLKIARLIVGVDDSNPAQVRIIPRLPRHWEGYEAQHWPILTASGLVRADIRCWRKADGLEVAVETLPGQTQPISFSRP